MLSLPRSVRLAAILSSLAFAVVSSLPGCAAGSGSGGADCSAGPACESRGWCGWDATAGRCAALTDDHCEDALVCSDRGACAAVDGACVVTDATCAKRPQCAQEGRCHARGSGCIALDDDDCAPSLACTRQGRCSALAGRCKKQVADTGGPGPTPNVASSELPEVCQRMIACLSKVLGTTGSKRDMVKSMTEALLSLPWDKREETCTQAYKSMPKNAPCP